MVTRPTCRFYLRKTSWEYSGKSGILALALNTGRRKTQLVTLFSLEISKTSTATKMTQKNTSLTTITHPLTTQRTAIPVSLTLHYTKPNTSWDHIQDILAVNLFTQIEFQNLTSSNVHINNICIRYNSINRIKSDIQKDGPPSARRSESLAWATTFIWSSLDLSSTTWTYESFKSLSKMSKDISVYKDYRDIVIKLESEAEAVMA
jgi:hypothetical protein